MSNKFLTYLFLTAIIITGVYLTIKATDENSWDGWGFGSAQTMMTLRHWINDGWAKHYFLFLPAGYSKTVPYFDNPQLNQHAWIQVTGASNIKRVYYTRYPSGYLFPLAFLMELGFQNRFWFRLFQIIISLASLLLLYKFIDLIANKTTAFFAALFYMISVPFLDCADSLANMVIDDFLRFAILAVSILAIRQYNNYKNYNYYIWILYFILSISSYDSTFFIFIWLVGLDIIYILSPFAKGGLRGILDNKKSLLSSLFQREGLIWKWLFFASAPILAFLIQIIQNSWYLGFSGALYDFSIAFKQVGLGYGSSLGFIGQRFLLGILYPITTAFALSFRTRYILIFILFIIITILILKKNKKINNLMPALPQYLFLLSMAAFCQSLILSQNTVYKGRLLGLFASLLFGALVFIIIQLIKTKPRPRWLICFLLLSASSIFFLQIQRTFAYIRQWPNNTYDSVRIEFANELKNAIQPFHLKDIVIFSMFPPQSFNHETIPANMAVYYDMYYHNAPIIYFDDIEITIRDFNRLKQISEYPFTALIITKDDSQITELVRLIQKTSPKFSEESIKIFTIQSKHILLIF